MQTPVCATKLRILKRSEQSDENCLAINEIFVLKPSCEKTSKCIDGIKNIKLIMPLSDCVSELKIFSSKLVISFIVLQNKILALIDCFYFLPQMSQSPKVILH